MKYSAPSLLSIGAVALFVVTSCTPELTPEEQLLELCSGVISDDPNMNRVLLSDSVDGEALCSCYGKSAVAEGEAQFELHRNVLDAIYMARVDQGLGAEGAASYIEDRLDADGTSYPFTAEQMDGVGDFITDISEQLLAGEACGVSE